MWKMVESLLLVRPTCIVVGAAPALTPFFTRRIINDYKFFVALPCYAGGNLAHELVGGDGEFLADKESGLK